MKSNYTKDIYNMYEKEHNKNVELRKEIRNLKLEISNLIYELSNLKKNYDNQIEKKIEEIVKPLTEEIIRLTNELEASNKEIYRLKKIIESYNKDKNGTEKDYIIDKLTNQVNKDSTNSGIPTSKEMKKSKHKTGANTYNHREKKTNK